jgi:hypothetical protein
VSNCFSSDGSRKWIPCQHRKGAVVVGFGIDWQSTTQDALANRSVHLSEVLMAFRHLNGHSNKAVSRLVNKERPQPSPTVPRIIFPLAILSIYKYPSRSSNAKRRMAPKAKSQTLFPAGESEYRSARLRCAVACQNYNRQPENATPEQRTALWLE